MTVAAVQRAFCGQILEETAPDMGLFGADAERRLGIYRNAYRARLMSCLKMSFEKTWSWVGDDAFDTAARQHIILHPPSSWTLDVYGAGFDTTLEALFADDAEVAELAWIEWAMQRAFGAPDEDTVDAAAFQRMIGEGAQWDAMPIVFAGSLSLRTVRTNATGIWQAIADGAPPPSVELLPEPAGLSVWRKHLSPHYRLTDQLELDLIDTLRAGTPFGSVCALLGKTIGEEAAVARAGSLLGTWLADGMIARIG
jgi:hypothetical protein